jgi:AcrR family transcriptional regulator
VEQPRRPYDLDRLTDVALRVFAERGFDGASMDDVARAAGITKAAIYHHVSSKEALLERGLRRALEALFAVLEEPASRAGAPLERLRHVVRRVVELSIEVLPELTVLVRVRGNSPAEREALARRRAFDAAVAAIVREAQAAGEFDAALDPALFVRLAFGMCNSIVEWYRPDGRIAPAGLADATERLIFEGVARRRAP